MIAMYQRFISPYKGFSCAYRVYTGRLSCSSHGYRVIKRYGIFIGVVLLKRRLRLCGSEHRRHVEKRARSQRLGGYRRTQAGFCDFECDSCVDMSDICSCGCDVLNPTHCDFGESRRKKKADGQYVAISPGSTPRPIKQKV